MKIIETPSTPSKETAKQKRTKLSAPNRKALEKIGKFANRFKLKSTDPRRIANDLVISLRDTISKLGFMIDTRLEERLYGLLVRGMHRPEEDYTPAEASVETAGFSLNETCESSDSGAIPYYISNMLEQEATAVILADEQMKALTSEFEKQRRDFTKAATRVYATLVDQYIEARGGTQKMLEEYGITEVKFKENRSWSDLDSALRMSLLNSFPHRF